MSLEWGLVILGAILVAIAARPVSRSWTGSNDLPTSANPPAPEPAPTTKLLSPARVQAPDPAPQALPVVDSLTPAWLDSLIGSDDSAIAEDPFDDIEGIASVLRLWLAEDSH